jgi:hypothetical protein
MADVQTSVVDAMPPSFTLLDNELAQLPSLADLTLENKACNSSQVK